MIADRADKAAHRYLPPPETLPRQRRTGSNGAVAAQRCARMCDNCWHNRSERPPSRRRTPRPRSSSAFGTRPVRGHRTRGSDLWWRHLVWQRQNRSPVEYGRNDLTIVTVLLPMCDMPAQKRRSHLVRCREAVNNGRIVKGVPMTARERYDANTTRPASSLDSRQNRR